MNPRTESDVAFEVFIGMSNRARMSPEEKALYDYHRGRPRTWDEIAEDIRDYQFKQMREETRRTA